MHWAEKLRIRGKSGQREIKIMYMSLREIIELAAAFAEIKAMFSFRI